MQPDRPFISVRLQGTLSQVRKSLALIRTEVVASGASADFCGRVETVVAEVLNNVVEHALVDGQAGNLVTIKARFLDHGCRFQITDTGRPLPEGKLPEKHLPSVETAFENLPEGGFGWALVHTLAHSIRYTRTSRFNRLSFVVPFESPDEFFAGIGKSENPP